MSKKSSPAAWAVVLSAQALILACWREANGCGTSSLASQNLFSRPLARELDIPGERCRRAASVSERK
jgi:hypothetical protein